MKKIPQSFDPASPNLGLRAHGGNLLDLIALAREEMQDVPDDTWIRLLTLASQHFGTRSLYVNAPRQRHLQTVAASLSTPTGLLAAQLGLSRGYVNLLKRTARGQR